MKKIGAIKTGFSILGAIKNKKDHNRFEDEIAHAQRMAMFGNSSASSANIRVSHLQGNLNQAWNYIKQNLYNLSRIFLFHNRLVKKHNSLCKKVEEQQKEINELKQKLKTKN